jgi:hypothetical protein
MALPSLDDHPTAGRISLVAALCASLGAVGCSQSSAQEALRPAPSAPAPDGPSADALRGVVANCKQVSSGLFKVDSYGDANVPVCGLGGAVFWTADLDVDCDGRESTRCNGRADPDYQAETAAHDAHGQPLDAAALPYVVVPGVSDRWSYKDAGLRVGRSVVAVVYGNRVVYGVIGDVGPKALLGEASYAMAERLGMSPDPRKGGVDKGVLYIAFTGPEGEIKRADDTAEAERTGRRAAGRLIGAP